MTEDPNQGLKDFRTAWKNMDSVYESYIDAEVQGQKWLDEHGFDYVWWFGGHLNTKMNSVVTTKIGPRTWAHENTSNAVMKRYVNHPFDYYAEKGEETWFIDATTYCEKTLNKAVIEPYLRRHKLGILFVIPNGYDCYLKEIDHVTSTLYLGKRDLEEIGFNLEKGET